MSFRLPIIRSFRDELEKIASPFPVVEDPKEAEKYLKPGDILLTRPKGGQGLSGRLVYTAISAIQGTPWTHTALYLGNGKIVDPARWEDNTKVHSIDLKKFTNRYQFRILRVDATPKQKVNAVTWAKKQIGKGFDIPHLVRMAFPVSKNPLVTRLREASLKSMICSQLVSNAYPDQHFGKGRRISDVRPIDIAKSPLTHIVAEFR